MAVRSSPRLQAIFCSDPSGKQAVFVPRMTKVTSIRTLRKRNSNKRRDVRQSGPTVKRSKEVVSESLSVSGDLCKEGNGVSKFSRTCMLRKSSVAGASKTNIQKDLKIASDKSSSKKTNIRQMDLKTVSPTKQTDIIRHNATGSGETSDVIKVKVDCTQQKDKRPRTLASPSTSSQSSSCSDHDPNLVTGGATTTLNVKRKRGRPPKRTRNGCKRMKVGVNGSSNGSPSDDNTLPRLKISEQVIDLTHEDEAISDEVDAALFAPSSSASPNLTQTKKTQFLPSDLSKRSNCLENDYPSTVQGASVGLTENICCSRTSLHSGESVAQLYDLTSKQNLKENHCTSNNEAFTIPSLKRSREVLIPLAREKSLSLEQIWTSDYNEAMECMSSSTEEEYPQPSTPQQKLMRRLARQKQLEEMRAKEAALLREERLLRRKGILPKSHSQGSSKRISWKDETDLVEMFIYSPVHDDDEDTLSIHSDDPNSMEVTLPV